jgi:hypothetical protein
MASIIKMLLVLSIFGTRYTFIVIFGIALLLIHGVLLELVYLKYDHNLNAIDANGKNLALLILSNHIANI